MKRKVIALIPASMSSGGFPGKPLAKILGLPIIEHVRRRCSLSKVLDETYVVTPDAAIKEAVENYGGKVILSAAFQHQTLHRLAEAAAGLNLEADAVVLAVSCQEPLFSVELPDTLAQTLLKDPAAVCAQVVSPIVDEKDVQDKNIVKALLDLKGRIMCFSHAPVPYRQVKNYSTAYRQIGFSAFTKGFLLELAALSPSPLEITEGISLMRALEHGHSVQAVVYDRKLMGVHKKEDIGRAEDVLHKDYDQSRIYQAILNL